MQDMPGQTHWAWVFGLFLIGVAAASLLGKVPIALPLLRQELELSHFQAGLMVSVFSLVSGTGGAAFGAICDRYGHRRMALVGLLVAGIASLLGALSSSYEQLLATRALEGVGFLLISVSIPPLMLQLTRPTDHHRVMGLWGAFLPAGAAAMMLVGGALSATIGWQGLWFITAAVLSGACFWFSLALKSSRQTPPLCAPKRQARSDDSLRHRGPIFLTAIFAGYSAQFFAVTAFVPLILVEQMGWSVAAAGLAGALVISANIAGSLLSGLFLGRGCQRQTLVLIATMAMIVCAGLVFWSALPDILRVMAAVSFSGFGGVIPGAVFAGLPIHAVGQAKISTVSGMLLQGAAFGQLVGPVSAAWLVSITGSWESVLSFTVPVALATALVALALGRLESRAR